MKKHKMKNLTLFAALILMSSCVFAAQSTIPPVTDPAGRAFTVVIDPAHGGGDWGVSSKGIQEKDIVLDLAKRLKKKLESIPEKNITVILTRDKDTFIEQKTRISSANEAGADLYITIHCDNTDAVSAEGFRVYYNLPFKDAQYNPSGMELWDTVHNKYQEASQRFAAVITQYMSAALLPESATIAGSEENDLLPFSARPQEGVRSYTLKGISAPGCELVLGNFYSKNDFDALRDQQVLDRAAYHIKEGIMNFLKTENPEGSKDGKKQ